MNTRRMVMVLLAILTLIALYMMMVKPPVRAQADADQKSIPGFSVTSTDVFAA
jgi:type II secretory pathway component PulM